VTPAADVRFLSRGDRLLTAVLLLVPHLSPSLPLLLGVRLCLLLVPLLGRWRLPLPLILLFLSQSLQLSLAMQQQRCQAAGSGGRGSVASMLLPGALAASPRVGLEQQW
jgi:hypothetical protein